MSDPETFVLSSLWISSAMQKPRINGSIRIRISCDIRAHSQGNESFAMMEIQHQNHYDPNYHNDALPNQILSIQVHVCLTCLIIQRYSDRLLKSCLIYLISFDRKLKDVAYIRY